MDMYDHCRVALVTQSVFICAKVSGSEMMSSERVTQQVAKLHTIAPHIKESFTLPMSKRLFGSTGTSQPCSQSRPQLSPGKKLFTTKVYDLEEERVRCGGQAGSVKAGVGHR